MLPWLVNELVSQPVELHYIVQKVSEDGYLFSPLGHRVMSSPLSRKCGSLDVSQPYGPSRSITGTVKTILVPAATI
jgi:hypothetical protein